MRYGTSDYPPYYPRTQRTESPRTDSIGGNSQQGGNRIFYLDALKAFSMLAMILLHVSAVGLSEEKVISSQWNECGLYNSLCHFCVPVFVMISGALLLGNDKPIGKYIKRVIISLIFWCTSYAIYVQIGELLTNSNFDLRKLIICIFKPTHLWFLWMILCMYIATPILRYIIRNHRVMEYFIIIWLIFAVIIPGLTALPIIGYLFSSIKEQTHFTLCIDYSGYYILGYYLANKPLNNITKYVWFYIIGGITVTYIGTYFVSRSLGVTSELFLGYFFPTTFIVAVGVFLLFKQCLNNDIFPAKLKSIVYFISAYSLGIYAIHMFFLVGFHRIGFTYNIFSSVLSIPLIWAVCLALSLLSIWIIKRFIPGGNKII